MNPREERWLRSRARAAAPPAAAAERLAHRVERSLGARVQRERPRPSSRLEVPLACGALLALSLAVAGAFWHQHLRPLEEVLSAEQVQELRLGTVTLHSKGDGAVAGTRRKTRIEWRSGSLQVDVHPDAGVELWVQTPEALVRVHGTRFTVLRDALGTHVQVERGQVGVSCDDPQQQPAQERRLLAGEQILCLPIRASGLLGRARALLADGEREAALATLRRGLDVAERGSAIRGELLALRVEQLLTAGDTPRALVVAQAYLDGGHQARKQEMLALIDRFSTREEEP